MLLQAGQRRLILINVCLVRAPRKNISEKYKSLKTNHIQVFPN